VTPSKALPPHPSFESFRKQAKKLVRQFAAGDSEAQSRVQAHLPVPNLPLTLRDAQLILAREYGFAGWKDLRAAVLRREGRGLEWAVAEAERTIHDNQVEQLENLIREYPDLLTWRGDSGESLLRFATESFGDSGDPNLEKAFTRLKCAEFLIDAGAFVDPAIIDGAIQARAKNILQLLSRKGLLSRNLDTVTALGDDAGVREFLPRANAAEVTHSLVTAVRLGHRSIASRLLERSLELDPALRERVERWRGRSGFLDHLLERPPGYGNLWLEIVTKELESAMHKRDMGEFTKWLEPEQSMNLGPLVRLVEVASYNNYEPFIARILEFAPEIGINRPPSAAVLYALEYGNSHLLPLLTPIWPLPDDLPHAAGSGDFARVKGWFDEAGRPALGTLTQHHPFNNPSTLQNLHWLPPNAQYILDTALAWACMNKQLEIASYLLEHGANINTDWSTHEPASILHECAVRGKYEAAQFLVDHGIDMTTHDYRWSATAKGWAMYAAIGVTSPPGDTKMVELLEGAERARGMQSA
jgi:hypothetical protein